MREELNQFKLTADKKLADLWLPLQVKLVNEENAIFASTHPTIVFRVTQPHNCHFDETLVCFSDL